MSKGCEVRPNTALGGKLPSRSRTTASTRLFGCKLPRQHVGDRRFMQFYPTGGIGESKRRYLLWLRVGIPVQIPVFHAFVVLHSFGIRHVTQANLGVDRV